MNAYRRVASKRRNSKGGISASRRLASVVLALLIAAVLTGCGAHGVHGVVVAEPSSSVEYAIGYDDGFASDADYVAGYDDSWFTVGSGPILYDAASIPFIDDVSYSAGFWDGVFDAYNDGYYVAYRYAFVVGFSEGYDNGYWSDFLDFLAADFHPEFDHGGFSDGYHDGFSEGRVFGAFDFEAGLPFDWLDALLDWESGTDLVFSEVGVGTGAFGPVILYEWGTDPLAALSPSVSGADSEATPRGSESPDTRATTRSHLDSSSFALSIARPLTAEQQLQLNVVPPVSLRDSRPLLLTSTWLDRIDSYNATGSFVAAPSTKRLRSKN